MKRYHFELNDKIEIDAENYEKALSELDKQIKRLDNDSEFCELIYVENEDEGLADEINDEKRL